MPLDFCSSKWQSLSVCCLLLAFLTGCAQPAPRSVEPAFCMRANGDALALLDHDELLPAYSKLKQCSSECIGASQRECNQTSSALSTAIDSLYHSKAAFLTSAESQRTPGFVLRNLRQLSNEIAPLYVRIEQDQGRAVEGTQELNEIQLQAAQARQKIPRLEIAAAESARKFEQDARAAIRNRDFLAARRHLDLMFENDPKAAINIVVRKELIDAVEEDARRSSLQAEKLIQELSQLSKSDRPSVAQKSRATAIVRELNQTLKNGLTQAPGDEKLLNVSKQVKIAASKQALARLGTKEEIEEQPETAKMSPLQLLAKARSDLSVGKVDDARSQARVILQANNSSSAALWADAQIIIGLSHAINIPDSAPDSPRGKESRQLARNEFSRALAANPGAVLPAEFAKFRPIFDEARRANA